MTSGHQNWKKISQKIEAVLGTKDRKIIAESLGMTKKALDKAISRDKIALHHILKFAEDRKMKIEYFVSERYVDQICADLRAPGAAHDRLDG